MSVQAMSWVIENSKHQGAPLVVLLMIANRAHPDGTNAYASIESIADDSRMSARQVRRIISTLEASGELRVNRSAGRFPHRFAVVMRPPDPPNPDKLAGLNPDKSSTQPGHMAPPTRTNRDTHIRK